MGGGIGQLRSCKLHNNSVRMTRKILDKDDVSAGSGARRFLSSILEPVLVPNMLGTRLKCALLWKKVSSLQDHLGNLHLPKR